MFPFLKHTKQSLLHVQVIKTQIEFYLSKLVTIMSNQSVLQGVTKYNLVQSNYRRVYLYFETWYKTFKDEHILKVKHKIL